MESGCASISPFLQNPAHCPTITHTSPFSQITSLDIHRSLISIPVQWDFVSIDYLRVLFSISLLFRTEPVRPPGWTCRPPPDGPRLGLFCFNLRRCLRILRAAALPITSDYLPLITWSINSSQQARVMTATIACHTILE